MASQEKPRPPWQLYLGIALLPMLAGCLRFLHPVPEEAIRGRSAAVPAECSDHVYVFLLHGVDFFDSANLHGVRDSLDGIGFHHTEYGQFWDAYRFKEMIRHIRETDSAARIAVVGFSRGARMGQWLCETLSAEGVCIDLLVYLDGKGVSNFKRIHPETAPRIVNIIAPSLVWSAPDLEDADNLHVPALWHFGTPTNPQTLERLSSELIILAEGTAAANE